MKFRGSIFQNAMMYNNIITSKGVVTIHNTDEDGYGFISSYAMNVDTEINIILSKKDYQTLSMLDEMDISTESNKIFIKTKNGKITMANLYDVHLVMPNTDEVYPINVVPSDFEQGEKFVGNDKVRIQLNGCNVSNDSYFLSDSTFFFIKEKETNLKNKICIPKESFKYIQDMTSAATDEKTIIFMNQEKGKMFYTTLLALAMDAKQFKLNFDSIADVEIDKNEFVHMLKMLKNYDNKIQINYSNEKLHLKSSNETNDFDIVVTSNFKKGTKFNVYQNIDHLLKMLEIDNGEKTVLEINEQLLMYKGKDFITGSLHFIGPVKKEVE